MLKPKTQKNWAVGKHIPGSADENTSHPGRMRPAAVIFFSLVLAGAANHMLASWLGFSHATSGYIGFYRRVGPETGPQAFCAGSSLFVSALNWSKVSEALGQGIETWSVAGSTPEIWEEWQQQRPLSDPTIIGISVYDLNEMHVAPERANIVPLSRTISDLWASDAGAALSHRILTQYPLGYLRVLFPTAGSGDKVLIGLRSKVAHMLGREGGLAEGVVVQPSLPLLDAGESTERVSDWSSGKLLRRVAALQADVGGHHEFFNGPKRKAFHRMLLRAQGRGRLIVVVLPVSKAYSEEFLDESSITAFEKAIREAMAIAPDATFVRLDHIAGISDPGYFFDLVHMNSLGRRLATEAFLTQVAKTGTQRKLQTTSTASTRPGN
jgi:hypothetical protein